MIDGFEVEWSATGLRSLDRLPENAAVACADLIYGALADNPKQVGRALRFALEGKHGARRGDYRIIYQIDEPTRVITILAVDHRRNAYRRR